MLRLSKSVFIAGTSLLAVEFLFFYLVQQYSGLIERDVLLHAISVVFPSALDITAVFTFFGCLLLAIYMPADRSLNLGLVGIVAATVIRFFVRLDIQDWRSLVPLDARDATGTFLVLMALLFAGGLVLVLVSWVRLSIRTP
jgi:hypothetical protein